MKRITLTLDEHTFSALSLLATSRALTPVEALETFVEDALHRSARGLGLIERDPRTPEPPRTAA